MFCFLFFYNRMYLYIYPHVLGQSVNRYVCSKYQSDHQCNQGLSDEEKLTSIWSITVGLHLLMSQCLNPSSSQVSLKSVKTHHIMFDRQTDRQCPILPRQKLYWAKAIDYDYSFQSHLHTADATILILKIVNNYSSDNILSM